LSNILTADLLFKAKVVNLILSEDTEEALEMLVQYYKVAKLNLRVGMPKGYSKKPACYVAKTRTIYVSEGEVLRNPRVILHEFYHHLRTVGDEKHKGTEKYANKFAKEFIEAYKSISNAQAVEN